MIGIRGNGVIASGAAIILLVATISLLSIEFGSPPRSLLSRFLTGWGPNEEDRDAAPLSAPDASHWLGTDIQRRDLLSRILHGARLSLMVGLAAETIALTIGLFVGALAGWYGGWIDTALMRTADVLLAIPLPILAMAAMAVFEARSIALVFVVLGLLGWAGIARLVRAQCLSVRSRGWPEAARALGAGNARMIALHLLPTAALPALVAAASGVAGNILTEAWLSFLGLGAQPPAISWGQMIVEGQSGFTLHPGLSLLPGLALGFTVLGFILLADGLRDALDPRTRVSTHTSG